MVADHRTRHTCTRLAADPSAALERRVHAMRPESPHRARLLLHEQLYHVVSATRAAVSGYPLRILHPPIIWSGFPTPDTMLAAEALPHTQSGFQAASPSDFLYSFQIALITGCLFHPTVSSAACATTEGFLSCPHGLTARIDF
jgi:hypothetical protein